MRHLRPTFKHCHHPYIRTTTTNTATSTTTTTTTAATAKMMTRRAKAMMNSSNRQQQQQQSLDTNLSQSSMNSSMSSLSSNSLSTSVIGSPPKISSDETTMANTSSLSSTSSSRLLRMNDKINRDKAELNKILKEIDELVASYPLDPQLVKTVNKALKFSKDKFESAMKRIRSDKYEYKPEQQEQQQQQQQQQQQHPATIVDQSLNKSKETNANANRIVAIKPYSGHGTITIKPNEVKITSVIDECRKIITNITPNDDEETDSDSCILISDDDSNDSPADNRKPIVENKKNEKIESKNDDKMDIDQKINESINFSLNTIVSDKKDSIDNVEECQSIKPEIDSNEKLDKANNVDTNDSSNESWSINLDELSNDSIKSYQLDVSIIDALLSNDWPIDFEDFDAQTLESILNDNNVPIQNKSDQQTSEIKIENHDDNIFTNVFEANQSIKSEINNNNNDDDGGQEQLKNSAPETVKSEVDFDLGDYVYLFG